MDESKRRRCTCSTLGSSTRITVAVRNGLESDHGHEEELHVYAENSGATDNV